MLLVVVGVGEMITAMCCEERRKVKRKEEIGKTGGKGGIGGMLWCWWVGG